MGDKFECDVCMNGFMKQDALKINIPDKFNTVKKYKSNCLMHCTEKCFQIFREAEILFRDREKKLFGRKNILDEMIDRADILKSGKREMKTRSKLTLTT